MNTKVINFLAGHIDGDHRGRTIKDICSNSDQWLEDTHDFIQWLFPLPEASQAIITAPVISDAEIAAIKANPDCQDGLIKAHARMSDFYGLPYKGKDPNDDKIKIWASYRNHNFLRITRILRSLALLDQKKLAEYTFNFIELGVKPYYPAVEASFEFWKEAVKGERTWPY